MTLILTPEQARRGIEELENIRASLADWVRRYECPVDVKAFLVPYSSGPEWHVRAIVRSRVLLEMADFTPGRWYGDGSQQREWVHSSYPSMCAYERTDEP